ncbi:hypothetical protein UNDKW_4273 [Undibacterium sp. KW1]|uniref:hypothetical protein n=1 Tax=Undibacterium sp. KW1 TaxID=2058624 RepID=UPI001331C754|nr:hypothetical protein [Undibacterium sp. KW1]BBB62546.1 hypothetical protein UNDKW_4273 [Undibacterium sp. KW1]
MKTTLKRLFIFLVVTSNFFIGLPEAKALVQKFDLKIAVLNSTSHAIEFCFDEQSCKLLEANKQTFVDAYQTDNQPQRFVDKVIPGSFFKLCDKTIPAKQMLTEAVLEKAWWRNYTYKMTISEMDYRLACGDVKQ